jgi:hypothetical protein
VSLKITLIAGPTVLSLATVDEEIVIFSHKVTGIALGALVFWLTFLFV